MNLQFRTYPGHFITFEGGEGSGKSTLIKNVAEQLRSEGYDVSVTREPGGTDTAEVIRDAIMECRFDSPRTEALLYAAAREENLSENVIPNLKLGKIVLCDRYIDSSLVYQGIIGGIGVDEVYEMNKFATDGLMPERTIYLDLDPEIGLSRIASDGSREISRIDRMDLDFHRKVRAGYQEIASSNLGSGRIRTVDASRSRDDVLKEAMDIINHDLDRSKDASGHGQPRFTGEMLEKELRKGGWFNPSDMLLASRDGRDFCMLHYRPDCFDSFILSRYSFDEDGSLSYNGKEQVHSLKGFEKEKAADVVLSGRIEVLGKGPSRIVKYKISALGSDNIGYGFGGSRSYDSIELDGLVNGFPVPIDSTDPNYRLPGNLTGVMMKIYSENQAEVKKTLGIQKENRDKAISSVGRDDGPEMEI